VDDYIERNQDDFDSFYDPDELYESLGVDLTNETAFPVKEEIKHDVVKKDIPKVRVLSSCLRAHP